MHPKADVRSDSTLIANILVDVCSYILARSRAVHVPVRVLVRDIAVRTLVSYPVFRLALLALRLRTRLSPYRSLYSVPSMLGDKIPVVGSAVHVHVHRNELNPSLSVAVRFVMKFKYKYPPPIADFLQTKVAARL